MKVTLALLMAAAISTASFQAADAQNVPYNSYVNNGSFMGDLLKGLTGINSADPYFNNGYSPYLNSGSFLNAGVGGNCGNGWRNGNGWQNGNGRHARKKAKQIRKMQRKMARRAVRNAQFGNQFGASGYQNGGYGQWGF
jgi:hypothetical protein